MNVLIACEFSGVIRDAFRRRGHAAWSCDNEMEPEGEFLQFHYACDVREILDKGWDLMISHPPCTFLAVSGARWFKDPTRQQAQVEALDFVRLLMVAPIPRICVENPVSIISSRIRKPDQIIEPWEFGHPEHKKTCLWLKNLPLLRPTKIIFAGGTSIHRMAPGPNRSKDRSRTFPGFAEAMADQWGSL